MGGARTGARDRPARLERRRVAQHRRHVERELQQANRELDFMDDWYPIQVKQLDKVGRPDIDKFEAAMLRARRRKGFFVSFDYSRDAMTEIDAFFRREHVAIVPLTVRDILDEQIARKLV